MSLTCLADDTQHWEGSMNSTRSGFRTVGVTKSITRVGRKFSVKPVTIVSTQLRDQSKRLHLNRELLNYFVEDEEFSISLKESVETLLIAPAMTESVLKSISAAQSDSISISIMKAAVHTDNYNLLDTCFANANAISTKVLEGEKMGLVNKEIVLKNTINFTSLGIVAFWVASFAFEIPIVPVLAATISGFGVLGSCGIQLNKIDELKS